MKKIFIALVAVPALLLTSCNSSSSDKRASTEEPVTEQEVVLQKNSKQESSTTNVESQESSTTNVESQESLEYKVVKLERSGNGVIDGEMIPKFMGIIRIDKDYNESQMRTIAEEAAYAKPEIPLEKSILMIEFYKTDDPLAGLNYGIVKRINGVWECYKNSAYQMMKEQERQDKDNKAKYGDTWKARSKELADGGKIIGVFEYVSNTYEMVLQKGNKYYLVEFRVDSPETSTDELVKIGTNKYRYKDPHEDLLSIEGNKLVIYMPDIFEPGKLFVSDEWIKAK